MSKETSLEVYNEESGKLETRTPEQINKSKYLYDLATKAEIIRWITWKHFFDHEGYLDFDHTSKKSFILDEFDDSVRTVEKKLQAVAPFAELLPLAEKKLISGDQEASTLTLENDLSDEEKDNLKIINQIGLSKWRLFSRDNEADFSKTLSDGVVTFKDGRDDVDLDEILNTSFRDWDKKFKEERKKYQKKIANLEERNKKAEGERDHYKTQLENRKEEDKRNRELKAKFGKKVTNYEAIKYNLNKAEDSLSDLEHYLGKVEVGEDDEDESLRQRVLTILRSALHLHEMAKRRMPWLIEKELEESSAFPAAMLDEIKNRKKNDPRLDPESDDFDPDSKIED